MALRRNLSSGFTGWVFSAPLEGSGCKRAFSHRHSIPGTRVADPGDEHLNGLPRRRRQFEAHAVDLGFQRPVAVGMIDHTAKIACLREGQWMRAAQTDRSLALVFGQDRSDGKRVDAIRSGTCRCFPASTVAFELRKLTQLF
jgi:hypothetical protein